LKGDLDECVYRSGDSNSGESEEECQDSDDAAAASGITADSGSRLNLARSESSRVNSRDIFVGHTSRTNPLTARSLRRSLVESFRRNHQRLWGGGQRRVYEIMRRSKTSELSRHSYREMSSSEFLRRSRTGQMHRGSTTPDLLFRHDGSRNSLNMRRSRSGELSYCEGSLQNSRSSLLGRRYTERREQSIRIGLCKGSKNRLSQTESDSLDQNSSTQHVRALFIDNLAADMRDSGIHNIQRNSSFCDVTDLIKDHSANHEQTRLNIDS